MLFLCLGDFVAQCDVQYVLLQSDTTYAVGVKKGSLGCANSRHVTRQYLFSPLVANPRTKGMLDNLKLSLQIPVQFTLYFKATNYNLA